MFSARRVPHPDLALLMTSASPETPVRRRPLSQMSGASDGGDIAEEDECAAGGGGHAAAAFESHAVVPRGGGGGAVDAVVSEPIARAPAGPPIVAVTGPEPRAGAGGGCGCFIA